MKSRARAQAILDDIINCFKLDDVDYWLDPENKDYNNENPTVK